MRNDYHGEVARQEANIPTNRPTEAELARKDRLQCLHMAVDIYRAVGVPSDEVIKAAEAFYRFLKADR
jgi:hypothetical protein